MVGKLNYSKWDNLELSDDSDVEVHPNIDKRSFIRWKQQDIHHKREQRKAELQSLRAEIAINDKLAPLLDQVLTHTKSEGVSFYSRHVARLSAGRAERGNKDGPDGPTIDDMMLSLLLQINQEPNVKGKDASDPALVQALIDQLDAHTRKLAERQSTIKDQVAKMEEQDARKITSDSLREGWSSGHVAKPEPKPQPTSKSNQNKNTVTQIETLNSPSSSSSSSSNQPQATTQHDDDDDDDDDEEVPEVNESMLAFANLPSTIPSSVPLSAASLPSTFNPSKNLDSGAFEAALQFLASHKELLREENGATDALLVEAFNAAMKGDAAFARRCTEKGLMIQYCNKLGKDGVALFFRRMTQGDGRASVVFLNDVLTTFARIADRSNALASSQSAAGAGEEQIQLVAEDPNTVISFQVPDGPPPDNLELEGEVAEQMDVQQVKAFLQRRWDIFSSFNQDLKDALLTKELDQVNRVLGDMKCEEAERVVHKLDEAGILNFSSSEVCLSTPRALE